MHVRAFPETRFVTGEGSNEFPSEGFLMADGFVRNNVEAPPRIFVRKCTARKMWVSRTGIRTPVVVESSRGA